MKWDHLLARTKSSLRGKQSEAGSITPSLTTASGEKPREVKSVPYVRPAYEQMLARKGSYMGKFDLGITDTSKEICRNLLEEEQSFPQDTLFRDDRFDNTCEKVRAANETKVIRDISLLICPSAERLWICGATHLKALNESVNQGWDCAYPFYGPRPQPDYSVGFGRSAFTDIQLEKLNPFVGEIPDTYMSYFMATWQIYFPFLTCEVKCGATGLEVADRQNAHSMTLAVRGVVNLFRVLKRERELHREILAFSVSHNDQMVKIYGHYPVIDGEKTAFYRHPIKKFLLTSEQSEHKWASYKFVKNVYDIWMPSHLKRLCSVIDNLPLDALELKVLLESEAGESRVSQGLESHDSSNQTSHDAASRDMSQRIEAREPKKARKRGRPEQATG